jgi:FkbM family methyltransferase
MDLRRDIASSLPTYRIRIVFDVGANVGQSAIDYLNWFPESHIYCFEPVRRTFEELEANLRDNERIQCFRLAVGSSTGKGKMVLEGTSDLFFLSSQPAKRRVGGAAAEEDVEMITLDEFCQARTVSHINYLKIDTEGGDLEVLKGAENMIVEQRIDLLEVEAGMNPSNERHVPFGILKDYLEARGYFLFGVYEQSREWPSNEPHLRRTNPVFISKRMIEMNRGKPSPVRMTLIVHS